MAWGSSSFARAGNGASRTALRTRKLPQCPGIAKVIAMPRAHRRRPALVIVLCAVGLLFGLVLAEGALRLLGPSAPRLLGDLSYANESGQPMDKKQGVETGRIILAKPPVTEFAPDRPRWMMRPSQDFYLCYSHAKELPQDWMDAEGRVPVHINQFGLRERDSITETKPAGERRIVCLGDSFTFAWGIPVEKGWVRHLEENLRAGGKDIRTVNCGWAGTLCIDEYVTALKHRFHVFGPDAVVLTICMNDLLPSCGLSLMDPPRPTGIRIVDLARGVFGRTAYDLDPHRDWVGELLALPPEQALAGQLAHPDDKPVDSFWSAGTPQKALRGGRDWCAERKIPFLVVLWPFLQGLGPGRQYPFQKMHQLVADFCKAEGIPFHDVLPSLQGTRHETLWVTPNDLHANPRAQELATPAITDFVRAHTHW